MNVATYKVPLIIRVLNPILAIVRLRIVPVMLLGPWSYDRVAKVHMQLAMPTGWRLSRVARVVDFAALDRLIAKQKSKKTIR